MKNDERWKQLCAQASVEKDTKKLLALAQEINRLLQEQEERPKAQRGPKDEMKSAFARRLLNGEQRKINRHQ